jgi:hypothetical protein
MMEVLAMTYLINPPIFIPTLGKDVEVTHDGAWQYAAVIDKFWRGVLASRKALSPPEPALPKLSHPPVHRWHGRLTTFTVG